MPILGAIQVELNKPAPALAYVTMVIPLSEA